MSPWTWPAPPCVWSAGGDDRLPPDARRDAGRGRGDRAGVEGGRQAPDLACADRILEADGRAIGMEFVSCKSASDEGRFRMCASITPIKRMSRGSDHPGGRAGDGSRICRGKGGSPARLDRHRRRNRKDEPGGRLRRRDATSGPASVIEAWLPAEGGPGARREIPGAFSGPPAGDRYPG